MVNNHCLAKSIHEAAWSKFRQWLEYLAVKFNSVVVAVVPHYTSRKCNNCGVIVKKSLSTTLLGASLVEQVLTVNV